jgi:TolB protein
MTRERSIDERIRLWLVEEAPDQLPGRVLQATFERTRPIRQRRAILGWKPLRPVGFRWVAVVLALLVALGAAVLAVGFRPPPPNIVEGGQNGLIAFDADWQIYLMNGDGTGRRRIAPGPRDFWPIWSPDGTRLLFHRTPTMVFSSSRQTVQYWIAGADGSGATNITRGYTTYKTLDWLPSWSPASDAIVFASGSVADSALYIAPVDGQGIRQIVDTTLTPSAPTWSPTGETIAFRSGYTDADPGIYLVNTDGSDLRKLTVDTPRLSGDTVPLWSPDGRRLLFSAGDIGSEDLWLIDADGSNQHKVDDTPFGIADAEPAWSPDGTQIAFQRIEHAQTSTSVYVIDADGSNPIRVFGETPIGQQLTWSPDGKHVLTLVCSASCNEGREGPDIMRLDPRGVDEPLPLANEPGAGMVLSWQRLGP